MESTKPVLSLTLHIFLCFFPILSYSLDTLLPGKTLHNNETLVSQNGVFELGLFSFSESSHMYLAIWLKNDETKRPVWIGNREDPLIDSSGFLRIRHDGNLLLSDRRASPFVVNNGALATRNATHCTLHDSGNFVLIEGVEKPVVVWQSFDYPTDTFLPGMKLGVSNLGSDQLKLQFLIAWLSPSLPGIGQFSLGINGDNMTRFNVWRRDHAFQEIGFWDGEKFRFFFEGSTSNYDYNYDYDENGAFLSFKNKESNVLSWFVLGYNGMIVEFRMVGGEILSTNHSLCDDTLPRNSTGCLVMWPSSCKEGDNFSVVKGKIPSSVLVIDPAPNELDVCELICKDNCSCSGYGFLDGEGCELFYGNRNDLLNLIETGNLDIYVRNDASKSGGKKKRILLIVTATSVPLFFAFSISLFFLLKTRGCLGTSWSQGGLRDNLPFLLRKFSTKTYPKSTDIIELGAKKDHELPLLSFSRVVKATNNFSVSNKLGEGGYGPVYKTKKFIWSFLHGKFLGQDIAVKRLSHNSGQGLIEFKNEVELISKLQHRNLVKLLACCIQRQEKILIYEYMPNKSLDSFIFDQEKRLILDWRKRRLVIEGIAQGLLYLHKYSRLRIIHRDLKTSNILLDENMNPKISDFGLARIFYDNESQAETKRLAGTYGYMAPEYAVHGVFSTKSDVFSFGVILLEIISGRKNATFLDPNSCLNLLGHAWELWKADRCAHLLDQTTIGLSCSLQDVMLCIQVGLLCVQEGAEDRPSMSEVVSMLGSEGTSLPPPKQPSFSTLLSIPNGSESMKQRLSQNLVTMSAIEAR